MSEPGWRRDFKRRLVWLFALKILALTLIGWFLFPASARPPVDPARTAEHLGAAR